LLVVIAGAVGQRMSRRLTFGDESSDEFRLAAIVGGKEFTSRAGALRSASLLAVVGGVEIDMREATLDAEGATLEVTAVLGGVEVTLPPDWRVRVEKHGSLGGVDVKLTDSAERPESAPTLNVVTRAWLGGIEIKS
jgi:predicted membrane protein